MKIRLKKLLNKYKNKIFSFIAVFAFIPLFSVNSFAADISPDAKNEWFLCPFDTFQGILCEYDSVSGTYNGTFVGDLTDPWKYATVSVTEGAVLPVLYSGHKYLFYTSISMWSDTPFVLSSIYIRPDHNTADGAFTCNTLYNYNTYVLNTNNIAYIGEFVADRDIVLNTGSSFFWQLIGNTNLNGRISWSVYVLDVTYNSQEQISSIIDSINNQTDVLGGYIDKGNSSTGGIVSDNNSAVDNLNEVVSEYHATEQQFFDDFTANQQAINSDIVGWSWGGLVNCANWVGETMTDYYNNMGDFRQYIIYPLMLGIVLFFLGRGGAIIGHLFRKPTQSTVNIESTSFKRGNTRYTTTTTSKRGGVFRK